MTENEISNIVIGLAIEVHRGLGPRLLEKAYKECLYFKINQAGLFVEKEKAMPLLFEDVHLDCG
jgi:GxxExxY protein